MKSGKRGDHFQFISDKEQSTSTTTSGMPFVKCHKGVQDGALYPMEEGLLFFKLRVFFYRYTYVVLISSLFGTVFKTFIVYTDPPCLFIEVNSIPFHVEEEVHLPLLLVMLTW